MAGTCSSAMQAIGISGRGQGGFPLQAGASRFLPRAAQRAASKDRKPACVIYKGLFFDFNISHDNLYCWDMTSLRFHVDIFGFPLCIVC